MPKSFDLASLIDDAVRDMTTHERARFERLLILSLPELIANAARLAIDASGQDATSRKKRRDLRNDPE